MWCLAHRLELAVKDALSGTFFDSVNEVLLRLYYSIRKIAKEVKGTAGGHHNRFE